VVRFGSNYRNSEKEDIEYWEYVLKLILILFKSTNLWSNHLIAFDLKDEGN
jgi:hypothetical protein